MITEKTLTFDKIDDIFFKEVATEIEKGFTVSRISKEPPSCSQEKNYTMSVTVYLRSITKTFGF